jgi:ATP-dependent exoDNAse (exonuclease V) alpha subunit
MRHFDHGYAVTSHSSQGLTAQPVLVNMGTDVHPELINSRTAYVSVSRGSHDAHIYTNSGAFLAERLSHNLTKTSAVDVTKTQGNSVKHGLEQEKKLDGNVRLTL